jgi:hypothetical protein
MNSSGRPNNDRANAQRRQEEDASIAAAENEARANRAADPNAHATAASSQVCVGEVSQAQVRVAHTFLTYKVPAVKYMVVCTTAEDKADVTKALAKLGTSSLCRRLHAIASCTHENQYACRYIVWNKVRGAVFTGWSPAKLLKLGKEAREVGVKEPTTIAMQMAIHNLESRFRDSMESRVVRYADGVLTDTGRVVAGELIRFVVGKRFFNPLAAKAQVLARDLLAGDKMYTDAEILKTVLDGLGLGGYSAVEFKKEFFVGVRVSGGMEKVCDAVDSVFGTVLLPNGSYTAASPTTRAQRAFDVSASIFFRSEDALERAKYVYLLLRYFNQDKSIPPLEELTELNFQKHCSETFEVAALASLYRALFISKPKPQVEPVQQVELESPSKKRKRKPKAIPGLGGTNARRLTHKVS